jgi:hypothetical protein
MFVKRKEYEDLKRRVEQNQHRINILEYELRNPQKFSVGQKINEILIIQTYIEEDFHGEIKRWYTIFREDNNEIISEEELSKLIVDPENKNSKIDCKD